MSRTTVIIVGFVALLIAIVLFFLLRPSAEVKNPDDSPNLFNNGDSGGDPSYVPGDAPVILTLVDGSTLSVQNFIPAEQPEWYVEGDQLAIAGSGEWDGPGFSIRYSPNSSTFNISILREPIGEKRREAEGVLRNLLGIADSDMCRLNMSVYVFGEVSDTYAGRNLGLSFCPGSVPLP